MDFMAQFKPTQTISVSPPGGTGHHGGHHHPHPIPGVPIPEKMVEYVHSSHTGQYALWIIFAMFTVAFLGSMVLSLRVEKKARLFHWLSATLLATAMISYFAMATGQGVTYVTAKYVGSGAPEQHHVLRQVFYARYIDWVFTTPLLLVSLGSLAGLSPADTMIAILFDVAMIVTGLLGGLTPAGTRTQEMARWGFYAVSNAFFLAIWFVLLSGGAEAVSAKPRKTRGLFYLLTFMTIVLWTAYPIVFGLTEGANKISVDAEIISYGVLDVAAKIGFTFILLILHEGATVETGGLLPDWFVDNKAGMGHDGRGAYGAVSDD